MIRAESITFIKTRAEGIGTRQEKMTKKLADTPEMYQLKPFMHTIKNLNTV